MGWYGARFSPLPLLTPSWNASQTPSRVVQVTQMWCHFPSLIRNGSFATWRQNASVCCAEPTSPHIRPITEQFLPHLVVYEYFHRVVSPLYEHQLVGLTWNCVGERCAHSGGRVGFEPHAHGERVHLRQTLLHLCVHVIRPQRERELEFVQRPVFSLTCEGKKENVWLEILCRTRCHPWLTYPEDLRRNYTLHNKSTLVTLHVCLNLGIINPPEEDSTSGVLLHSHLFHSSPWELFAAPQTGSAPSPTAQSELRLFVACLGWLGEIESLQHVAIYHVTRPPDVFWWQSPQHCLSHSCSK